MSSRRRRWASVSEMSTSLQYLNARTSSPCRTASRSRLMRIRMYVSPCARESWTSFAIIWRSLERLARRVSRASAVVLEGGRHEIRRRLRWPPSSGGRAPGRPRTRDSSFRRRDLGSEAEWRPRACRPSRRGPRQTGRRARRSRLSRNRSADRATRGSGCTRARSRRRPAPPTAPGGPAPSRGPAFTSGSSRAESGAATRTTPNVAPAIRTMAASIAASDSGTSGRDPTAAAERASIVSLPSGGGVGAPASATPPAATRGRTSRCGFKDSPSCPVAPSGSEGRFPGALSRRTANGCDPDPRGRTPIVAPTARGAAQIIGPGSGTRKRARSAGIARHARTGRLRIRRARRRPARPAARAPSFRPIATRARHRYPNGLYPSPHRGNRHRVPRLA